MTISTHTEEDRAARIRRRRELGDSLAAIARDEGLSKQRVHQIARTAGAPTVNAGQERRRVRVDRARRAATARPVTTNELATRLDVVPEHAARIARAAGLTRTPEGWVA